MIATAQEPYPEFEIREQRRRAFLVDQIMLLWHIYKSSNNVSNIPFLDIPTEEEAAKWLATKETGELDYELYRLSAF